MGHCWYKHVTDFVYFQLLVAKYLVWAKLWWVNTFASLRQNKVRIQSFNTYWHAYQNWLQRGRAIGPQKMAFCCKNWSSNSVCCVCTVVNGSWSSWSKWAKCSLTCSTGVQTRIRTCTNPEPQHNGASCAGNGTASRDCYTPCPGNSLS